MSDFMAKMHHIRSPPQTLLGVLTALSQASYLYLRGLLLRGGREETGGKGKVERKGKIGEGCPQLGSLDPAVEEVREGEKGNEGSLGWGVQALLSPLQALLVLALFLSLMSVAGYGNKLNISAPFLNFSDRGWFSA